MSDKCHDNHFASTIIIMPYLLDINNLATLTTRSYQSRDMVEPTLPACRSLRRESGDVGGYDRGGVILVGGGNGGDVGGSYENGDCLDGCGGGDGGGGSDGEVVVIIMEIAKALDIPCGCLKERCEEGRSISIC